MLKIFGPNIVIYALISFVVTSLTMNYDSFVVANWPISNSFNLNVTATPQCPSVQHPERRPELVHIRKTGGSTLEILAAMHNMSWGACHWHTRINDMPKGLNCPPSPRHVPRNTNSVSNFWHAYRWHIPPKYMEPEDTFWLDNAAPFVVSRNPYDRAVSAWNYGRKLSEVRNATLMNEHLIKMMTNLEKYGPRNGGVPNPNYFLTEVPQTEYITEGVRVLRSEHLQEDFQCMMKGHGYDWEWPEKKTFNKSRMSSLTKANLTEDTIAMIARLYHNDFEQLGYSKEF